MNEKNDSALSAFRPVPRTGVIYVMTEAERLGFKMHHPDWCNVYKTVQVDLNTHDAGGITALDIELAQKMDALLVG